MFKQSQDCTATNPRTVELSIPTEQNAEIVLSAWISLYVYFNKKYSKAFVPCWELDEQETIWSNNLYLPFSCGAGSLLC